MTQTVAISRHIRRPVEDTSAFVTDMHTLVPSVSTFKRCAFVGDTDDGQLWDVFLQSGTIYLGGRVLAVAEPRRLHWRSIRGTHHTFEAVVDEVDANSGITLKLTFSLAGFGTGRFSELIGRGIVSRTLTAAAEEIRHQLEFERDTVT